MTQCEDKFLLLKMRFTVKRISTTKKAAFTICMERGNGLLMGEDARMAVEVASIIPIFIFCYKKSLISEEIKLFQSIWWR